MPGALPHNRLGPDNYQVSAQVIGGQLVCKTTANATTVIPAGAGAINVLGVAGGDAAPIVSQTGNTTGYGDPLLDISALPDYVSVYHGVDIHVNYANAADFGDLLMAAASGAVTPFTGTTYSQVIGRCSQPGGVTGTFPQLGRARIFG